jgi:hypothetical protein
VSRRASCCCEADRRERKQKQIFLRGFQQRASRAARRSDLCARRPDVTTRPLPPSR